MRSVVRVLAVAGAAGCALAGTPPAGFTDTVVASASAPTLGARRPPDNMPAPIAVSAVSTSSQSLTQSLRAFPDEAR